MHLVFSPETGRDKSYAAVRLHQPAPQKMDRAAAGSGFEGERIRVLPEPKACTAQGTAARSSGQDKRNPQSIPRERELRGPADSPGSAPARRRYQLFHSVSDDEGAWLAT